MSSNAFAYLVLFAFLPLGTALFVVCRPPVAALLVFVGAFLFLPEGTALDLPALPGIGKQEVATLACLFGALMRARADLWSARPLRGPELLVILLFVGNVATSLTNTDVLQRGPTTLPALNLHEAFSLIVHDALRYLLPFFLGRALIRSASDLRSALVVLAVAGAVYTPFLFVELMMSPQLHRWTYGFHQHDFLQTIRGGGYRPMVFTPHGLAVGLFMAWAALAAVTLYKAKRTVLHIQPQLVGAYDFGFLVACKSLGAALYASVGAPLLLLLRPKTVARVIALLGILVVTYPVLRATDLFPSGPLVSAASSVSTRAAQSLQFRFDMEQLFMDHAAERPVFGWGRFKRNMVFDEWTGRDVSVSDGHWIVTYSIRGAWGFVCIFGLIVAPLLALRRRIRRVAHAADRIMLAGLGLIVAVGAVDLLPNALQNVVFIFFCGALWGVARSLSQLSATTTTTTSTTLPPPVPQPQEARA